MIQKEKKRVGALILLCCVVYFTSYLTRHNYAAALAEIVRSMGITKEQGSFAITGMFITYGLGQLLSGWLGDKIHPRYVIFGGLLATAVCNLGMGLLSNIGSMTALWCVNGVAQAMLWPPLVRVMAENMGSSDYRRASLWVSIAASFGSIAVYLMVPGCIALSGWRSSFFIPAVIGIAVALLWLISEPACELADKQRPTRFDSCGERSASMWQIIWVSGLIPIMLSIILQGMLRDGITTWMPTYITETYHLQTGASILTTVVLPIFSVLSISAASWLQAKVNNDLTASTLLFALACVSGVALYLFGGSGAAVSVVCMMLITGCMHGINMLLISRLPAFFARYGRVSTISGILNTFTYIGSAASAYGFAAVSQHMGWTFTVGIWAVIALLGALCCGGSIRRWKKFIAASGQ